MRERSARSYSRTDGPILEWTFDGDIKLTHSTHRVSFLGTFEVEDGTVDITSLSREYVEGNLQEPLENAGLSVNMEDEEEDLSVSDKIKKFITL